MDEAYFRECLGEWIESVSTLRKFEPLLCAASVGIGIGTVLLLPSFRIVGYLAIAVGVFEAWRYRAFKRRWLAERLGSKLNGTVMRFELGPGRVRQLAPAPASTDALSLARVVASRRGYFVYPKNGAFVYLPHASIVPAVSREEVLRTLGAENWSGFATGTGT
jgi:hypothetical protein